MFEDLISEKDDGHLKCPTCGSIEVGTDTSCGKFDHFCIKCSQRWPFEIPKAQHV